MKSDQARLLRMAAVLPPIAVSSMVTFLAADGVQETGETGKTALSTRKDVGIAMPKEIDAALRGRRLEFFSCNPAP